MKKIMYDIYNRVINNIRTSLIACACAFIFYRYSVQIDKFVTKFFDNPETVTFALKALEFGLPSILLFMKDKKDV